jgi:hypothetical protein
LIAEDELEFSYENFDEDLDWETLSTPNLVGQTTVGGQIAPDLDNKRLCIWFAFSVLSIRTEGVFKLRFSLFDLTQMKGYVLVWPPTLGRGSSLLENGSGIRSDTKP